MSNLIWFEWKKCTDGYSLETFKPEYLEICDEPHHAVADEEIPRRGQWAYPSENAPSWVDKFLKINNYRFGVFSESLVGQDFFIPRSDTFSQIEPLKKNSAAFLEFAECWDSTQNVTRFVNNYGVLNDKLPIRPLDEYSLSVSRILNSALKMHTAVRLWEKGIEKSDFEDLYSYFNTTIFTDKKDGSDWAKSDPSMSEVYVKLRRNQDRMGLPYISIVPEDLESALWFQFAQAVSGTQEFIKCVECPSWYEIAPGAGRPEKKFCSDACRMRAYRKRNKGKL